MTQEVATQDILPPSETPFSQLTVQQRDAVLTEIAKSLHYNALISRTVMDRSAKSMDALAAKIDSEHEKLAADYSDRSGKVVYRAIELLDEFNRRMDS